MKTYKLRRCAASPSCGTFSGAVGEPCPCCAGATEPMPAPSNLPPPDGHESEDDDAE